MGDYAVLLLLLPFVVTGIAAAIPRQAREDIWWTCVLVVLVGAVVSGAWQLLNGGLLFFAAPDY